MKAKDSYEQNYNVGGNCMRKKKILMCGDRMGVGGIQILLHDI